MKHQDLLGKLAANPVLNSKSWYGLYLIAGLSLVAALLFNHHQIVNARYAIDYYEGAMSAITGLIAEGHNPYAYEFLPQFTNPYPPLYNLIAAPLTHWFGNTLPLHRGVAGGLIIASCLLCYGATLRASGSKTHSLAAAATLYAVLLYNSTPLASTNSTGIVLFLASTLIPWHYNFSNRSLAASIACGVLAFYGKQYFILGLGLVSLYLFIAVSKRRAILFGTISAICTALSLFLVIKSSPYYLDTTVFLLNTAVKFTHDPYKVMLAQMRFFVEIHTSVLILIAAVFASNFFLKKASTPEAAAPHQKAIDFINFDKPLFSFQPNYFVFCFLGTTFAVAFSLGKNAGNYMSYLFQLMSPFLLIAVFSSFSKTKIPLPFLLPFIFIFFYKTYSILPTDFAVNNEKWQHVDKLIASHDNILASPILTSLIVENDKPIFHNGLTFFFPLAKGKPQIFVRDDEARQVTTIWDTYNNNLFDRIERQGFDLLILTPMDAQGMFSGNPQEMKAPEYLKKYYKISEEVRLDMTDRWVGSFKMQVWVPKTEK